MAVYVNHVTIASNAEWHEVTPLSSLKHSDALLHCRQYYDFQYEGRDNYSNIPTRSDLINNMHNNTKILS